ncbi:MAG: SPASM domain-containing protein, partial [Candidatus Obscuribacterales bacterium]|nr:SPASM domain-containing protein [Candidatus Obscuribacterales bacterium]
VEFTLSISLDSPHPLNNDSARGRGEEVIAAIKAATREGLDVTLSAVVHKQNLTSALSLPAAFPELRQFRYSPVVTRHLDDCVAADLQVEESLMERFWQEAADLQQRLGEARILLPIRKTCKDRETSVMQKEHDTCYCGFTSCVIDSQFNLYPCDWARTPLVKMGNLELNTIESIWTSKQADQIRTLGSRTRLCLMEAQSDRCAK